MTLGEKIKYLRQKNDVTQEKLAEYLNITYQSISKWENNLSQPDVSMIVPLANFFGVTIDELFDRDAEQKQAEIEEYKEKYLELANKGCVVERVYLAREAVKKYPNNFECLKYLAEALYITLHGESNLTFDEIQNNVYECIEICERILRDCTDSNIRSSAIQLLVLAYSAEQLSCANEEKAIEYANMAPGLYVSRELLLTHAHYTDEGKKKAVAQSHNNTLHFMDLICNKMYLSLPADFEGRIFVYETALKLWRTLIYDDNFLFYSCRISNLYKYLSWTYAALKNREKTIENLKLAFEYAKRSDEQPTGEQHYTSIFVSEAVSNTEYTAKNYTHSNVELVKRYLDNKYDFLRDDPEFIELLNTY